MTLKLAGDYIDAFGNVAKEGNTILLPANLGDAAGMVTQAMTVFDQISGNKKK